MTDAGIGIERHGKVLIVTIDRLQAAITQSFAM